MKNKLVLLVLILITAAVFPQSAFCAAGIPLKKVAFKFIIAMAAVIASSLILFVGLSIYNKLFKRATKSNVEEASQQLDSPKNLKDAINRFLNRTNFF